MSHPSDMPTMIDLPRSPLARRLEQVIDDGSYGSRSMIARHLGMKTPELGHIIVGRAEFTESEVDRFTQLVGLDRECLMDMSVPLPLGPYSQPTLRKNLWTMRERLIQSRMHREPLARVMRQEMDLPANTSSYDVVAQYMREVHQGERRPSHECVDLVAGIAGVQVAALDTLSPDQVLAAWTYQNAVRRLNRSEQALRTAKKNRDSAEDYYRKINRDFDTSIRRYLTPIDED